MKKAMYFVLLAVEFVVGFGLLYLVSNGSWGWPLLGGVTVVWAALMAWLLVRLKKAAGTGAERKAKRNIALGMLVPLLGAIGGLVAFIISFAAAGLL